MPFQDSVVTNEKFLRLNMVGVVRKNVSVSYSSAICYGVLLQKATLRLVYESLKEEQELAITSDNRAKSRDLPYPVQG